jgi:hypothetical protein
MELLMERMDCTGEGDRGINREIIRRFESSKGEEEPNKQLFQELSPPPLFYEDDEDVIQLGVKFKVLGTYEVIIGSENFGGLDGQVTARETRLKIQSQ